MEWKSIKPSNTLDGEFEDNMPPAPSIDGPVPQDIASTPVTSKPAGLRQSDEEDLTPLPPLLSTSVGSVDMPPRSPPPLDDMVPSAQPPEAKMTLQSPLPLDLLEDAGHISKEEQELGDVLKESTPLFPQELAPTAQDPQPPSPTKGNRPSVHFGGEVVRSLTKDGESSLPMDSLDSQQSMGGEQSHTSCGYEVSSASRSISSSLYPQMKPADSMFVHRASGMSAVSQSSDWTSRTQMESANSLFVHRPSAASPTKSSSFQSQSSYSIGPVNSLYVNAAADSLQFQSSPSGVIGPTSSMFVNTASTASTVRKSSASSASNASSASTALVQQAASTISEVAASPSTIIATANSMFVNHASDSDIFIRPVPNGSRSVHPVDDGDYGLRAHGLAPPGEESALQRALCTYSTLLFRCPCCFVFMYIFFFAVLIGAAWRPLEIESDFSAFIRADGDAMRRRDAFQEALSERRAKQSSRRLQDVMEGLQWKQSEQLVERDGDEVEAPGEGRRLRQLTFSDVQLTSQADVEWLHESHDAENGRTLQASGSLIVLRRVLTLTYMPESRNAFDSRLLKGVRDFEARLRSLESWREMCSKSSPSHQLLCDPGESFIAYAYPSRAAPAATDVNSTWFEMTFDAVGADSLQIPAALAVLQQSTAEMHNMYRFFPKDYTAPAIGTDMSAAAPPSGMRTHYTFYLVVGRGHGNLAGLRKSTSEMIERYDKFITGEVFPLVQGKEIEGTRVLYSGDVITSFEISRTLRLDVQWAIGSVVFITLYLWLHTGSILLAMCCLLIIFTAVPVAYVLTPASTFTVASFLSFFLVIGIGCDVVFVFTDCWEQSYTVEKTRSRRLAWMLLHAGRNCLATSLTTAASFFANLASALQPLREFGLFMGLSVFGAFVLVALFLPPLIVLREGCCADSADDSSTRADEVGEVGSMAIVPSAPLSAVLAPSAKTHPSQGQAAKAKRKSRMERLLLWLMDKLAGCPVFVAIATVITVLVFVIGVATSYELDQEVPDIFPADHNQIRQAKAQEQFAVVEALENLNGDVGGAACAPDAEWASVWSVTKSSCLLHWCEAPYATTTSSPSNSSGSPVTCWWNKAPPQCRRVDFRTRLAARSLPVSGAWEAAMRGHVQSATNASAVAVLMPQANGFAFRELNTLVLENWETGGMATRRFYSAGSVITTHLQYPVRPGAECIVDQICYQGEERCDLDGWISSGSAMNINFQQPASRRALQEVQTEQEFLEGPDARNSLDGGIDKDQGSRISSVAPLVGHRMLASLVPFSKRIDVTVLWGVRPARSTPVVGDPSEIWSFDPTFEPNNPWAQRAILAMCDSANLPSNLLVIETKCWIDEFRIYVRSKAGGEDRFPTRNFEAQIDNWYPTTLRGAEDIWRNGKQVQALKLDFILNLAYDIAAQPLLDHRDRWDEYVGSMNGAASVTGNRAYHTAEAWVRAEAEIAVISSTLNTIIVSGVSAYIGMLLFTQDPVLSFLVLALVLGIICGLAFFMVVIMGWKIGSIEVISLVIFVGYAVTYSLHVAHSYAEAREPQQSRDPDPESPLALLPADAEERLTPSASRKLRSKMAIAHIGSSVFSSALSTLGSSFMLLFCTMIIFKKLGSVVIAVTVLSVVCALIVLPALLMILGPSPEPWHKRCIKWWTKTRARLKRA